MANHIGSNFSVLIAPMELRGNFSSVSGLGATVEYDEYVEGGNFLEKIYLPKGMSYNNIVLERGTMTFEPLSTVKIWTVMDAMPVKVDYSPMDALSNSVAITSIEFIHGNVITIM